MSDTTVMRVLARDPFDSSGKPTVACRSSRS
jgi:hypothetical protein